MIQEDKKLLLTDLSARLPYGVKVAIEYSKGKYTQVYDLKAIDNDTTSELRQRVIVWNYSAYSSIISYPFSDCRPYLRPMAKMTKEEEKVYEQLIKDVHYKPRASTCNKLISWLKEHYFDYNYLIEEGLALEAPEGMYKIS